MLHKLKILYESLCGECIKAAYKVRLLSESVPGKKNTEPEQVVVCLTSYGRRVGSVLPYSLYSLLHQSVRPDRIVLWLDDEHWNDNNLPSGIKRLKDNGQIEVRYSRDMKSYKKLVPALTEFPQALIITVDDDLYYRNYMIERLLEEHHRTPNRIITHRAHRPVVKEGKLLPYNEWQMDIPGTSEGMVFPTGGAGCLYKKDLLYGDVTREDLFGSLCPNADDVWFYFMEVLNGTQQTVLPHKHSVYIPLDNFYQFTHKGSNLSGANCHESQNDVQICAVMKHYGIEAGEDGFIIR